MTAVWRYPFALLGIVFVLIGFALWPRHRTIPVLIYHDIATGVQTADSYTIDAALLSRELDYLKQNDYTPLTFAAAETLIENNRLPEHPVILTFDDALPGQVTHVLSALIAHGAPATFFINSDTVGDSAHLSWDNVRAIADSGMEIGGHTKTHAHLISLTDAQLANEVTDDKTNIERELGKTIRVFAYPFQEHDARTDAAVLKAGYTVVRDDATRFKSSVMQNSFDSFLGAI